MKIQCPQCNYSREYPEQYRGQQGKCPRCGVTFILPSTPIEPEVTNSSSTTKPVGSTATIKQCPFCAEAIHVDAAKCKHCGEFLVRSSPQPNRPSAAWPDIPLLEKRRTMFAWSFIAGIVIVSLVILFASYERAGYEVPEYVAMFLLSVAGSWTLAFLVVSIYLGFATYESEVARIGMTVLLFVPATNIVVPFITYFIAVSLIKKHKN